MTEKNILQSTTNTEQPRLTHHRLVMVRSHGGPRGGLWHIRRSHVLWVWFPATYTTKLCRVLGMRDSIMRSGWFSVFKIMTLFPAIPCGYSVHLFMAGPAWCICILRLCIFLHLNRCVFLSFSMLMLVSILCIHLCTCIYRKVNHYIRGYLTI